MVHLAGMTFRENEIIVLIGAGCSVDAGIPASKEMIKQLEGLLKTDSAWKDFLDFYNFVKSAILYSDGIKGGFCNNFDIERLVNVLSELEKKEDGTLYPFVGNWNPRLIEIAGYNFQQKSREFKEKILEELKKWVSLANYKSAGYYNKLFNFQSDYNYSLRIFSLNYDLCLEKNRLEVALERGFDHESRAWSWRSFEPRDEYQPQVFLYKLHGSVDWQRDTEQGNILREVDNEPKIPDLIFGTNYKMQYIDPYLFYAYELRKYSLESKVILTIGYSFRDEHINGILLQSLKNDKTRKIIIVSPDADKIVDQFPQEKNQFIAVKDYAKNFFDKLSIKEIEKLSGHT